MDAKVVSGKQKYFLLEAKTYFVSEQQSLFPQQMFSVRLNWSSFASTTNFPQQLISPAGPLVTQVLDILSNPAWAILSFLDDCVFHENRIDHFERERLFSETIVNEKKGY